MIIQADHMDAWQRGQILACWRASSPIATIAGHLESATPMSNQDAIKAGNIRISSA